MELDLKPIELPEIINEPGYDLYLAGRSQVARINSIELYAKLFPFTDNLGHLVREVQEREVRVLGVAG